MRQGGVTQSGPFWEAVLDGTGRSFGFHYNVLGVHPDFRADNGFVPRTGYVQPGISNRYTWYGAPGALLERFNIFGTVSGLWLYDDFFSARSILEDHASAALQATVRGGWSLGYTPRVSSYAFDPTGYTNLYNAALGAGSAPTLFRPSDRIETLINSFSISTPQFPKFTASVGASIGNDVDFVETSRVRRVDYNGSLDLRPSSRLRVGATYVASSFTRRIDDRQTTFTKIPRVEIEYQLARPVFVRVVSQYTATLREEIRDPRTGEVLLVGTPGALTPSTPSASNSLRTDWLFSYRPTPGTVFFLGYGGNLSEPDPLAFQQLRRTDDSFFMKASYGFR